MSFAGGGTDMANFYKIEDGEVISTTINKYVYVVVKRQIGIVEYKYRINWSRTEFRDSIDEIEHPIVREALRIFNIDFAVEITTFADIPAGTGMGSSSAFAVGLVHALFALQGQMVTKYDMASLAAQIEIDQLGRIMGKQDHFACAYGGFNAIIFKPNGSVIVEPVVSTESTIRKIEKMCMLFYTETKRNASKVLSRQVAKSKDNFSTLQKMKSLVPLMKEVLSKGVDLDQFGKILHEGWLLKQTLSEAISNQHINHCYDSIILNGALGGKLLGAGSGGFLLAAVPTSCRDKVRSSVDLFELPVEFDAIGTRITYFDRSDIL